MDQEMTGGNPLQIGLAIGLGTTMRQAAEQGAKLLSMVDRTEFLLIDRALHSPDCPLELIRVEARFITNLTDAPEGEEDTILRYWFTEHLDEDGRCIEMIHLSECPACGEDLTTTVLQ